MLMSVGTGFGYLAFSGLLAGQARAGFDNPMSPKAPAITPRAKRVVMLSMRGGPSHLDTFDYKPQLAIDEGKTYADRNRKLYPSPFKFEQRGQSGLWISELYPELSKHADDLCLVNSMYTDVPNHPQAFLMLHTGEFRFARPSVGAWVLYGLGTENQDLPGFVTISPPSRFGGAQNYGSSFLPAIYQGTPIGQSGSPVSSASISNLKPEHISIDEQRRQLDLLQGMNQGFLSRKQANADLEGVIQSYELAFRMQGALPDVLDLSRETAETLDRYGIRGASADTGGKRRGGGSADFGRQCLMARRLLESGVRFVELCHEGWDQHNGLTARLKANAAATDKPIAALLADLKQRDLLQDTLVIWGGEFGRTPGSQNGDGRDHNAKGFSMWLAGGGVKGGLRFGETDAIGNEAVIDKVHHHDLHATILHLLGLDPETLTYRYGGRDYKLTGVGNARVVEGILA
jgi:hypothetical protein